MGRPSVPISLVFRIYIYIYPRVGYDPLQDKEAELENFQWILEFLIKKKMGGGGIESIPYRISFVYLK